MPENVAFAVLADVHDSTVFRVELAYSVVSRHAAVLTQGGDDLVLEFSFGVQIRSPSQEFSANPS